MKAPIASVESHITALAEYPARLVGHHLDIVTYKRGLAELADMVLNIPCDNQKWEKFADVIAMTYYRWKKEVDIATADNTTYGDWVRLYLRPDLTMKMKMLLQM